jgi:hypothetical protein
MFYLPGLRPPLLIQEGSWMVKDQKLMLFRPCWCYHQQDFSFAEFVGQKTNEGGDYFLSSKKYSP